MAAMRVGSKGLWLGSVWVLAVLMVGGFLASLHQPFVAPGAGVLRLARVLPGRWNAVHVLSAGCGCSQRVMRHLLTRRMDGLAEQVVVVDGGPALPETPGLLLALGSAGFRVTHVAESDAEAAGLLGVPLLVLVNPQGGTVYRGGYGDRAEGEAAIFREALAGSEPRELPVTGCAVAAHAMRGEEWMRWKF